jgi:hypothetical protein
MPKRNLPTYAIVELLIRLESHNQLIGGYKDHYINNEEVKIKTAGGVIIFSKALIMQQFENPDLISDETLLELSSSFKPSR